MLAEMSGNHAGDAEKSIDLRRLFEESATHETKTINELDRNICEVTECIIQMQRFFNEKLTELKDLRKIISDSNTGRVISGYSESSSMIQGLEKKVAERETEILRLKEDVAQRDLILSEAGKNAEEDRSVTQQLNVDITEECSIEEMNRQITELREGLKAERITIEMPWELTNEQESKKKNGNEELISSLQERIEERNGEIEQLHKTVTQLQQNLCEKENQLCINKRLVNTVKIRQLKPLAKNSPEVAELLKQLRKETATIAERLLNQNCQINNSTVSASAFVSVSRPTRGIHAL